MKEKSIHEKKRITEKEARKVTNALAKEPVKWHLYGLGILIGGFRINELNNLKWSDINFDNNTISIQHKKMDSRISKNMPQWYMDELKRYQTDCSLNKNAAGEPIEFVFGSSSGAPLHVNVPLHWWIKFANSNDLDNISMNSLRLYAAGEVFE